MCSHYRNQKKSKYLQGWALQGTLSTLLDLSMLRTHFKMLLCLQISVFNICITNTHQKKKNPAFKVANNSRDTIDFQKPFALPLSSWRMPFPPTVSLSLPGAAFQFSANPTDQQLPEDLPERWKETHIILQTQLLLESPMSVNSVCLLYWSQLCQLFT